MTREEMATELEKLDQRNWMHPNDMAVVEEAAAELRKRCGTCRHQYSRWCPLYETRLDSDSGLEDQDGYCRPGWEAK